MEPVVSFKLSNPDLAQTEDLLKVIVGQSCRTRPIADVAKRARMEAMEVKVSFMVQETAKRVLFSCICVVWCRCR